MVDDDEGATAWEEFDVTSAVKRHVTQLGGGGKAAGLLRLRVTVGGAADRSRRRLVFGEDHCDDVVVTELRRRHHPVLNVLTRDRSGPGKGVRPGVWGRRSSLRSRDKASIGCLAPEADDILQVIFHRCALNKSKNSA